MPLTSERPLPTTVSEAWDAYSEEMTTHGCDPDTVETAQYAFYAAITLFYHMLRAARQDRSVDAVQRLQYWENEVNDFAARAVASEQIIAPSNGAVH